MGKWQDVAEQYFPEAGYQTPAELYIAAGTLLARRTLGIEVSVAPGTYSEATLADPYSAQSRVISASSGVRGEIIDTVGYRLGYEAMTEDARDNGTAGLTRLLRDPREDFKPTAFQEGWAALFRVPVSTKKIITEA